MNKYGFIETPYRKVIDGKVTDEVVYLSAMEEMRSTVAQANASWNADGSFVEELISAREAGEFLMARAITSPDGRQSPKQLVSVAASLIPFLENDDANRALMGSNMQRQAVPLVCRPRRRSSAPAWKRPWRATPALRSWRAAPASSTRSTRPVSSSAHRDVEPGESGVDIYTLRKFQRSNQSPASTSVRW
ncbi:MAG: hypothetical protein LKM31_14145 [Sphingobium sp.]|nr:hypothetical protein [Sphingobium sp.]